MTDSPPVVLHSGSLDSLKRHPVGSDATLTSPYTHIQNNGHSVDRNHFNYNVSTNLQSSSGMTLLSYKNLYIQNV